MEPREVSMCVKPPGFDSDLVLRADVAYFYRVWLQQVDYDAALRGGGLVVEGPPSLARQLPRWFMWSAMAKFVRQRETERADSQFEGDQEIRRPGDQRNVMPR